MPLDKRTVTEKRRAANRAAAQHSTGPRTAEGRRGSSLNNFKHGAFATNRHILFKALRRSGSDPDAIEERRKALMHDWQPAGSQQFILVDDLAWLYWLRDQARLALVESPARHIPVAELNRDVRGFQARYRAPAFNPEEHAEEGGIAAEWTGDRFPQLRRLLDKLEACVTQARWDGAAEGPKPSHLMQCLFGKTPSGPRGRRLIELWQQCREAGCDADDPRAKEILGLIIEERTGLEKEEALFRRQQELEIAQPEDLGYPELHPLSDAWQTLFANLERLDRQINAKIGLLLRLKKQHPIVPDFRSGSQADQAATPARSAAVPAVLNRSCPPANGESGPAGYQRYATATPGQPRSAGVPTASNKPYPPANGESGPGGSRRDAAQNAAPKAKPLLMNPTSAHAPAVTMNAAGGSSLPPRTLGGPQAAFRKNYGTKPSNPLESTAGTVPMSLHKDR
jgi:hypothetical protein